MNLKLYPVRYGRFLVRSSGYAVMFCCEGLSTVQVQEGQERSKAAAAKHDSVMQQLSAEHAHTLELDSQIEGQHKVRPFITCVGPVLLPVS